jgi:hypothetical protein
MNGMAAHVVIAVKSEMQNISGKRTARSALYVVRLDPKCINGKMNRVSYAEQKWIAGPKCYSKSFREF